MTIKDMLGLGPDRKVRYAVVGLGDIAQEAMLPGIAHTGNSRLAALVTSDPEKAAAVGAHYGVESTYTYEQFPDLLASGSVDAIYLATPNWRHAEFVIPALKAGIHVLVEKPLEISTAKCQEIIDAQKQSTAKLMVAYRLHFEPATLALLSTIRSGELGDVHVFSATFAQMVAPDNHRASSGELAGPVLDMGPYPVNAARYVFSSEPTDVISAIGTRHAESGLGDFDHTVAVTLLFPQGKLAQFVVSYYANAVNSFHAMGTKGSIVMNPSFTYGKPLAQTVTVGEKTRTESFKNTDHFGGEMKYFSDCILTDAEPEPDAEEGFADVRVLEGILLALKTGKPVKLAPFSRSKRIDPDAQLENLRAKTPPDLVNASNPARGVDKGSKN
jgi:predicted dehydrogenase